MSHGNTSRFFKPFMEWLLPGLSGERLEGLHILARKGGHLTGYAILAMLLWFALGSRAQRQPGQCQPAQPPAPKIDWRRAIIAVLICMACAALDESLQSSVPTRGGTISDVLLDTTGAALGIAVIIGFTRAIQSWRTGRALSAGNYIASE